MDPDACVGLTVAAVMGGGALLLGWLTSNLGGGGDEFSDLFQRFGAAVDRIESRDPAILEAEGRVRGTRVRFRRRMNRCELEVEVPALLEWSGSLTRADLPPDGFTQDERLQRLQVAAANLDSFRISRGWLIVTLRNRRAPLRDSLDALVEAARHFQAQDPSALGDLIRLPDQPDALERELSAAVRQLSAPVALAVDAREPGSETCPYCRDALGGETFACPDCGTQQHRSCWDELSGCTTLGCARAPRSREPEA